MNGWLQLLLLFAYEMWEDLRSAIPALAGAGLTMLGMMGFVVLLSAGWAGVPRAPRTYYVGTADQVARLDEVGLTVTLEAQDAQPHDAVVSVPRQPTTEPWVIRSTSAERAERARVEVEEAVRILRHEHVLTDADRDRLSGEGEISQEAVDTLTGAAPGVLQGALVVLLGMLATLGSEKLAHDRDLGLWGLLRLEVPGWTLWLLSVFRASKLPLFLLPLVVPIAVVRPSAVPVAVMAFFAWSGFGFVLGSVGRLGDTRSWEVVGLVAAPVSALCILVLPEPWHTASAWLPIVGLPAVQGLPTLVWQASWSGLSFALGGWAFLQDDSLLRAVRQART